MVDFMTQIARIGKRMTTREQIAGYFQSQFPGDSQWRSEMARRLQPHTTGKNGQPQSYASVRRRFEGNRLYSKQTEKTRAEYEKLGKELPRLPPERGYHVKGEVCISVGGYPPETRKWDFKVVGSVADYLYQTGSLQALVNVYMGDVPEEEEPQAALDENDECKSSMKVTALSVQGARHLPNIDQSK